MANPPKNIDSPIATINHISLSIILSLLSLAPCPDCPGFELDPDVVVSAVSFAAWFRKEGRRLTSIIYIDRTTTIIVIIANAFW